MIKERETQGSVMGDGVHESDRLPLSPQLERLVRTSSTFINFIPTRPLPLPIVVRDSMPSINSSSCNLVVKCKMGPNPVPAIADIIGVSGHF